MSTLADHLGRQDEIHCRLDPHAFLCALEADFSLYEPGRLQERLMVLDDLDAIFGGFDCEILMHLEHLRLHDRAKMLRERLETANAELYRSIRSEMIRGGQAHALLQWIHGSASQNASGGDSSPGLGFDWRDELLSGVLQFCEPHESDIRLSPEMVPYQPTPVRHILDLIADCSLSEDDVLIDIGSGLGHVPLLVSMLAGIESIGIEIQSAYVASSQQCAEDLHLSNVRFIGEDARAADLSSGNVFYLFSPCTGSILGAVLSTLRIESIRKSIKICSLGPCTHVLERQEWLGPVAQPDAERITVFKSRMSA